MLKRSARSVSPALLIVFLLFSCNPGSTISGPDEMEDEKPTVLIPPTGTTIHKVEESSTSVPSPTSVPPTETITPFPTPEPTDTPSWVGPDSFPEGVNPLTGLKVEDPDKLERRPVLIKVSNYPAYLRPHSGLSYADVVFSYFIGVGMTRYLALYYGQDAEQVGPMRSGRLIDPQIVNLYGGFLGMVGADRTVWTEIANTLPKRFLTEMPINCPALCADGFGTVFANTEAFTERVRELGFDDQRPPLPGMIFDSRIPEGGMKLSKLWLYISYYNQVEWEFNPENGEYLRSQEEAQADGTIELKPMTDRLTGEQLTYANVVILFAMHNIIKPELIDIELQSVENGRAFLLRDGQMFEMTYSAISPSTPLRFYDPSGRSIAFKPGNTWFEIVGLATVIEELETAYWKIRFYP